MGVIILELERKREEQRAQWKQKYEEKERQERERKEQKKKDKQKSQKDGQAVVDEPVWKPKPLDPKMRAEIEKIENRIKKLKQEEGRPFKSWLDEDDDLVSQKEGTREVEKIKPKSILGQEKQIDTVVPHDEQEKSNQTEKNKTWYKGLDEQTASKEGTSLFKNAPSQYQVTPDYFSKQAEKAGITSSRALEILMEPTPENFYDRVILTSRQNWLGGTQDKTAFDLEGLTNGQAYKYISQGVLKEDFPALSNNLISQRGASLFENATPDYFATQAEKAGMTSRKALDILMNPTPDNFYDRVMLTSRQNWLGGAQDKTAFALEGLTNGQAYKYMSQGCPKEDFSALSQDLISERLRTEDFDDQVLEDWGVKDGREAIKLILVGKMQKTDPMAPHDYFDLEGKMGGSGLMAGGAGGGKLGWGRLMGKGKPQQPKIEPKGQPKVEIKEQPKPQQPVKKVEGKQNVEEIKEQKINDLQKQEIATQNFNLKDGATLSEGKALDAAIEFLGKGYKDLGNGRFVSNDGLRQVRMGDGDLLGLHGGGRHMNFETLKVNPKNPAKLLPEQNLHIYLK